MVQMARLVVDADVVMDLMEALVEAYAETDHPAKYGGGVLILVWKGPQGRVLREERRPTTHGQLK